MELQQISPETHERILKGELVPRTLDELASLSHAELLKLYSRATVPSEMKALDGVLRGRPLAVRGTSSGPIFRAFAALEGSPSFPWEGKTLTAKTATEGVGVNRVKLPGLGRQQLFPFTTQFDPSALDGKPCVFIDYDNEDNPALIRAIRDEVREISPGLFFGPVCLKHSGKTTLLLWFGIQRPDAEKRARA